MEAASIAKRDVGALESFVRKLIDGVFAWNLAVLYAIRAGAHNHNFRGMHLEELDNFAKEPVEPRAGYYQVSMI